MRLSKSILSGLSSILKKLSKLGIFNSYRQESLDHSQLSGLSDSGSYGASTSIPVSVPLPPLKPSRKTSSNKPIKIALFAGPGAGKTTLAMAFTSWMKDRGYNWHYVHEYARDFIDTYGGTALNKMGPLIQCKFMDRQINLERKLPAVIDGFITDSPIFLGWMYAARNSKVWDVEGELDVGAYVALKDCYKGFLRSLTEYDLIIHVKREKAYMNDGTRSQTEKEAKDIDALVLTLLKLHNVSIYEVTGPTETRCQAIFELIKDELHKRNEQ